MIIEALLSGRIKFATQDGSCEFFSFFVCICADDIYLFLSFIYKSESESLQNT